MFGFSHVYIFIYVNTNFDNIWMSIFSFFNIYVHLLHEKVWSCLLLQLQLIHYPLDNAMRAMQWPMRIDIRTCYCVKRSNSWDWCYKIIKPSPSRSCNTFATRLYHPTLSVIDSKTLIHHHKKWNHQGSNTCLCKTLKIKASFNGVLGLSESLDQQ